MNRSLDARFDLVVLGLGYVGLPLARGAVDAGLRVAGLDPDQRKIDGLAGGHSHVDDVNDADIARMLSAGFAPTSDPASIAESAVAVICVPTPLADDGAPNLAAVEGASATVRDHLRAGMLVVLESTTYPGTTDDIVRPILEATGLVAGRDFNLAYSPERIDPGNEHYGLANTPKVIGGYTPECAEAARAFYSKFVDEVFVAKGTREAEMAKLLENTYRHINIALVNEMAVFCHELGVDLWSAIEAATTKPFGFQPFYPGPGVGGHCIPIDPNYLSYRVRQLGYPFRFVELAQEVNARMPSYIAQRIQWLLNEQSRSVRGANVLLLGVTYKAGVSDERESPALPLARRLLDLGAELGFHDPYVPRWAVGDATLDCASDLRGALAAADIVVLLQAHPAYDLDEVSRLAGAVLDTRGAMSGANVERL